MLNKVLEIEKYLNDNFYERKEEIISLLTAVLAKEHILLIGEPGTSKSKLSRDFYKMFEGNYFEYLLTQFTVPEEIYGPHDLKALEQGSYARLTADKLPEANHAFIDEIFKANSAILNSLLTITNERLFHNNGHIMSCPLNSVIGASNEFPEEDESLEALYDRFSLKHIVKPISVNNIIKLCSKGAKRGVKEPAKISLQELETLQNEVDQVDLPKEVFAKFKEILVEVKAQTGKMPSARTAVKCVQIVKAYTLLKGSKTANITHLEILKHVLWEEPTDKNIISDIIADKTVDLTQRTLQEIDKTVQELIAYVGDNNVDLGDKNARVSEIQAKVKDMYTDLKAQNANNQATLDSIDAAEKTFKENMVQCTRIILGMDI